MWNLSRSTPIINGSSRRRICHSGSDGQSTVTATGILEFHSDVFHLPINRVVSGHYKGWLFFIPGKQVHSRWRSARLRESSRFVEMDSLRTSGYLILITAFTGSVKQMTGAIRPICTATKMVCRPPSTTISIRSKRSVSGHGKRRLRIRPWQRTF